MTKYKTTKNVQPANSPNTKTMQTILTAFHIFQLTWFSDPFYAKSYVTLHHYDIVFNVIVINRTRETLHNLYLQLATMGDIKLSERPQNYTLAPESKKKIKANFKVSYTETRVIFGNIVSENVMEWWSSTTYIFISWIIYLLLCVLILHSGILG